jgi:hypothetical protein
MRWTTLIALVAWGIAACCWSWNAAAIDGVIVAPSPAPIRKSAQAKGHD